MAAKRQRIGSRLLLVWAVTFIVVSAAVVVAVGYSLHALALHEARDKASMIAARSHAIHAYFTNTLKPSVFELSEQVKGPDYFDPAWMSSSYAVRAIQKEFREQIDMEYYYKECAINARSPESEADPTEADFLRRTNAQPDLKQESFVREIDGEPYFVVLERGEQMIEPCMKCHSDPARAPKDLVAEYGPTRGFGRSVGEFSSAVSLHIPLAEAYAAADETTRNLSLMLIGLFGLSLGGIYFYNRNAVFVPALKLQDQAFILTDAVVAEQAISQELSALNQELSATNEELANEVANREDTERELDLYKNSLEELVSSRTAELENAMSEAESANEAKSLFLANISHDLRTPLNSVIGFSDVLISGMAGEMNDEQRKQVLMINESGRYLLALVSDLLDLSRIENGAQRVDVSDFDLSLVIASVSSTISPMCAEKGIAFVAEGFDAPIMMRSDVRMLRQLLLNLLGNAVKFTARGMVTLRVSDVHKRGEVVIEVMDSGPGIASDELPHVFEAFKQFSHDGAVKPQGAGLGLAISLKIARLLGGSINAASTLGKGSVFTVRLPRTAPAVSEDANTPLE